MIQRYYNSVHKANRILAKKRWTKIEPPTEDMWQKAQTWCRLYQSDGMFCSLLHRPSTWWFEYEQDAIMFRLQGY